MTILNLAGKLFFVILVGGLVASLSGCGAAPSEDEAATTATAVMGEIQNVPEATPTAEPTATELPTEIGEPVSPISPVSPVAPEEGPAMSRAQNLVAEAAPGSEEPLAAAIADLSEQTGVPVEEIELVSIEAVEWNDASLGCPQEGYMYAQVITPGYRIILAAQGQEYEYHTDQATNVVLCEE